MKIVYLTAGAAGMYCGSCMHDNTLAKALNRLGHECLLVPVYTPVRTDEENASIDKVFFGGINIFLQQKLPWLGYLPSWLDAFLSQPGLIRWATAGVGKTDPRLLGALTVSMLRGMEGNQRKEVVRLCEWLEKDIRPDVLLLTNMLIAGCIPEFQRRSKARVYVTLQGDDIFFDFLTEPYREQALTAMRALVDRVDGFITHSQFYARRMGDILRIPPEKFHVVPLGIDLSDLSGGQLAGATGSAAAGTASPPVGSAAIETPNKQSKTIGYLARMAPEKGLHVLIDAFVELARQPDYQHVQLMLAGWMGQQHHSYWDEQKQKLAAAGLSNRYHYWGSVDRAGKRQFLSAIDIISVPTTYHEPKGISILEAVAYGVPYLQPAHGAFPEMHARLLFGQLFEPDRPAAMVDGLKQMLDDPVAPSARPAQTSQLLDEISVEKMATRTVEVLNR